MGAPYPPPHRQVLKLPKQILEFPREFLQNNQKKTTPGGGCEQPGGGRGGRAGGSPKQPLTSQVSRRRLMAALFSPMTMA